MFALATSIAFGLLAAYAQQGVVEKAIGPSASGLATLVACMQLLTVASVFGLIVLGIGSVSTKAASVFAALICVFLLLDARLYALMSVHILALSFLIR